MENFSSFLYDGLLVFGKYPTDKEATLLKDSGYLTFVDLCPREEITWEPYNEEGITRIHYPIYDRGAPNNDAEPLIHSLVKKIQEGEKIYIHCRGGHGRSATLAAVILLILTSFTSQEALSAVKKAHILRKEMKPKFRKIGAPQTRIQKDYVRNFKV